MIWEKFLNDLSSKFYFLRSFLEINVKYRVIKDNLQWSSLASFVFWDGQRFNKLVNVLFLDEFYYKIIELVISKGDRVFHYDL